MPPLACAAVALTAIVVAGVGCVAADGSATVAAEETRPDADAPSEVARRPPAQGQAAPADVPSNRCLATVDVLAAEPGPARASLRLRLPDRTDRALTQLRLRIEAQRSLDDDPEDQSFCVPGTEIEVLAIEPRQASVGARLEVELELIGDTRSRTWWLHRVTEPEQDAAPPTGES